MNEKMKEMLEKLAARECWSDGDESTVNEYAGGNIDDAYDGGSLDGETLLARRLLKCFGKTNDSQRKD